MGRDASGVQGMRMRANDEVISINIAQDDADLLVVTENGYGKRTRIADYPRKGRGGMGVKTIQLTESKGTLAGARVVRDGYQVMLISTGGTVIKMPVDEIKRLGRATQGVIVMRLRGDERVSALAPVVESDDETRRPSTVSPIPVDPAAGNGAVTSGLGQVPPSKGGDFRRMPFPKTTLLFITLKSRGLSTDFRRESSWRSADT